MKLKALALAGSAALSIALAMPAAGQTATGADRYVWDLPQEYPTDQSWERDREQVVQGIARLKELRGVAPRSAASLADVLDIMHATRGLAAHMARHAYLSSGVDTTSEKARSKLDSATALETQVEAAAGPLEEDIRSIGRDQVARWSQTEQRLRKFAHDRRLQHIFFEASHSPGPAVQPIIGSMEAWASSYGSLYDSLIQTAIKWPQIKDSRGNEFALTPDMYRTLRRDPSGQIRRQTANAFHDTAAAFETVFGTLFGRRVEADLAIARARGFDDSVVAAFTLNDAVAKSAITQATTAARAHADVPRRYARLLSRAYGTPNASYAEALGRSPWAFRGTVPVPEAVDLIVESVARFGPDYQDYIRSLFKKPWFHLAASPNKGAVLGVFIPAGGGNPYAAMTYTGDLGSVRTLAAIAQAMQMDSEIPPGGEPDRRDEDQVTFGNARWLMGQSLIDDALSKRATSPEQRAAILFDQLSRMWTELYYRSAMIELDHWVMEQVAAGTPPSGNKISAKYLELMRSFNGHGSGGLAVEDIYSREWITESTLFSTHHQNSFAASAAAAAMMIEGLEKGDQQILGKMRNVRGRRLEFSNDFLLSMGIDLSTTAPYEALIRRMQTKMDQIERELDEMKR